MAAGGFHRRGKRAALLVRECAERLPAWRTARSSSVTVHPGTGVSRWSSLRLSVAALTELLRQRIDPVFLPRPLLIVEELPRNATGKLPQQALQSFADRQSE
jgi:acyl-coenzyme A synthetase/AMP-(fatty) acid ligase